MRNKAIWHVAMKARIGDSENSGLKHAIQYFYTLTHFGEFPGIWDNLADSGVIVILFAKFFFPFFKVALFFFMWIWMKDANIFRSCLPYVENTCK